MFQSLIKWLITHIGTPTIEKEIIVFTIGELTSNTKLTATEIRTALTDAQTVINDALAGLPAA